MRKGKTIKIIATMFMPNFQSTTILFIMAYNRRPIIVDSEFYFIYPPVILLLNYGADIEG